MGLVEEITSPDWSSATHRSLVGHDTLDMTSEPLTWILVQPAGGVGLLVGDGVGGFEVVGVGVVAGVPIAIGDGLDTPVEALMPLGVGAIAPEGTLPHPERIRSAARSTALTEFLTPTSTFRYESRDGKATQERMEQSGRRRVTWRWVLLPIRVRWRM